MPVANVDPSQFPFIGTVNERYQSYNVEMVEVTGGRFWRPYDSTILDAERAQLPGSESTPTGMDPSLYEYRPPVDLGSAKLLTLAKALGPAYVRVSGTWSNRTYVPAAGEPAPETPPAGYGSVLTHEQWEGVINFCKAVEGDLVTSFAISTGVRDDDGIWTPIQAQRLLDLTRAYGGTLKAVEFFNEPNLAMMGGAPEGYTEASYGRDFRIFKEFMRREGPTVQIAGPGSVMETTGDWIIDEGLAQYLLTPRLLEESGPTRVDLFSYHHYGALSQRCPGSIKITAEEALSEHWLRRTDETLAFYKALRDQYAPGVPIWLTETAEAACGGNPWANTFLDTFRYLDQLGRLATQGVDVVMHNTLVASDYSLIHEDTLTPKPNYWAALLWRRLMGTTVLESGIPIQEGLHVYAHCMPDTPGGVTLMAINTSRTEQSTLHLPVGGNRYTLSATREQAREVLLNGTPLRLGANDSLPAFEPEPFHPGEIILLPSTITFLTLPEASNSSCR